MKYPIGIQDFESLITDRYSYVDKTRHIHELARSGKYYFLSRPRRFGKSLLLSTMKAYFLGKRELFKGLALESLEEEWTRYPVLYLDLNSGKYDEEGSLSERLNQTLKSWEKEYGDAERPNLPLDLRFESVIQRACEKSGQKVVILIDEYDKPLLQTIETPQLQAKHRSELKAFYSVLKTQDAYIRFAFLTGVTKFSKVSVFSDLNNLYDLSMDRRYVDICGLTETEIRATFDSQVGELAECNEMSKDECYAELRRMYDGYHFRQDSVGIYNPFSVLNALSSKSLESFWFATGTPTFLVDVLKNCNANLEDLTTIPIGADDLGAIDQMWENPVPVIYQSGYLTIKEYDKESKLYTLDYPNLEVKKGFLSFLLPYYTSTTKQKGVFYLEEFRMALQRGDAESFLEKLKSFFDEGDYRIAGKAELYFQNSMSVILRLLGIRVETEVATSRGRIDVTIQTDKFVYVLELKLDGTPEQALEQIEAKGYADKFRQDSRKLFKIGINFSSQTRSIAEYKLLS